MAHWYYSVYGTCEGPVSDSELRSLAADRKLRPSDLVWRQGMDEWVSVSTLNGLIPKDLPPPLSVDQPPPQPRGAVSRKDEAMATGKCGAKTVYPIKLVRGEGGIGIALKYRDQSGAEGKTTGIKCERSFRSLGANEGAYNVWALQSHDGDTYQVLMDDARVTEFENLFKKAIASLAQADDGTNEKGEITYPDGSIEVKNEKKAAAYRANMRRGQDAIKANAPPARTPRHGLGLQGDDMKKNHELADAVFAVKDFVTAATNKYEGIPAARIVGHAKFKHLLDAIPGYSDEQKVGLTKQMIELVRDLREKQKAGVTGPTATPPVAIPVAEPASIGA